MAREIWFACLRCGEEAYCGGEFAGLPEAEVMCPFCGHRMKLAEAGLPQSS